MNVVDTPTYQSTSVLHQVLAADPIVARYTWPKDRPAPGLFTNLAPDGKLLVATGTARLEVADPRTGSVLWSWPSRDVGLAPGDDFMSGGLFSADGTEVITGLWWGKPDVAPPTGITLGVAIWNAQTGELKRTIDVGPCGGAVPAVSRSRALVWTPLPGPDGQTGCHWPDEAIAPLAVVDLATGSRTALAAQATYRLGNGTLSGDGRFAGFDVLEAGACGASCFTSVVVDLEHELKRVFQLEQDRAATSALFARQLNEDGTLLLYGDRPIYIYRIADGATTLIAKWAGTGGSGDNPVFDPTDQTVLQTSRDGTLRRWDPTTGQVLSSWSAVGSGPTSVAADGRTVLVTNDVSATAVLLDIGSRGDLGDVQTCQGFTLGGSLKVRDGLAAFGEMCAPGDTPAVQVVDLQQRTPLASWSGWWPQDLAISPDGRSFVSQEASRLPVVGPLVVADISTGRPILELQGTCEWDSNVPPDEQPGCQTYPKTPFAFGLPSESLRWSPDGTMIAAVSNTTGSDVDGHLVVWDAQDGHVIFTGPADPKQGVNQVMFTPDSKGLVVSYFTTGLVEMRSTTTWEPVTTTTLDSSIFGVDKLGLIGFTPDGSTILAVGGFGGGGDCDADLARRGHAPGQAVAGPRRTRAHRVAEVDGAEPRWVADGHRCVGRDPARLGHEDRGPEPADGLRRAGGPGRRLHRRPASRRHAAGRRPAHHDRRSGGTGQDRPGVADPDIHGDASARRTGSIPARPWRRCGLPDRLRARHHRRTRGVRVVRAETADGLASGIVSLAGRHRALGSDSRVPSSAGVGRGASAVGPASPRPRRRSGPWSRIKRCRLVFGSALPKHVRFVSTKPAGGRAVVAHVLCEPPGRMR